MVRHFMVPRAMMPMHDLKVLALPFAVPRFDVKQFWHRRNHADASNKWLRRLVLEMLGDEPDRSSPAKRR